MNVVFSENKKGRKYRRVYTYSRDTLTQFCFGQLLSLYRGGGSAWREGKRERELQTLSRGRGGELGVEKKGENSWLWRVSEREGGRERWGERERESESGSEREKEKERERGRERDREGGRES